MRTPQIPLSPIGQSFPNLAIPGVAQIRGVLIDNTSGAWLLLRPTNDYIPPYTIGWARTFTGGVASVSVSYESPAGQVSTLSGDPAVIVLDTEPVPASSGSTQGTAFIEQFTPTLSDGGSELATVTGIQAGILAPVPGKRYRLLTVNVSLLPDPGMDSPITWSIRTWLGGANFDLSVVGGNGYISPMQPSQSQEPRIDFAIGTGIGIAAQAMWEDAYIDTFLTYQLI